MGSKDFKVKKVVTLAATLATFLCLSLAQDPSNTGPHTPSYQDSNNIEPDPTSYQDQNNLEADPGVIQDQTDKGPDTDLYQDQDPDAYEDPNNIGPDYAINVIDGNLDIPPGPSEFESPDQEQAEDDDRIDPSDKKKNMKSCWMTLNAAGHFKSMNEIDEKYKQARQDYHLNVAEEMDRQMLEDLLHSRGAAHRAIYNFGGNPGLIPAGINLGGYCMMRLQDSLLFFHRMKLRNSTNFEVNYLHNDMENMTLVVRLGLNDLHLVGTYERSATHKDPSILYYRPSYGTIELLLKNVDYKMDARLRMMSDRLTIELVTSELIINDGVLMSYLNTNLTNVPDYTVKVEIRSLEDFLQRLKTDLDLWLKDYFNDYLMYFELPAYDNSQIQEYEKAKTIYLNEYVNYAVNTIRQKISDLGGHTIKLPKFTIFSVPSMVLKIKDGVLRGMDSLYRRSVATGRRVGDIRYVDVIIGFSKLRVEYRFEAVLPNGSPPLNGILLLKSDEMTAHMGISLVLAPESLDLNFDFIQQMKPESLTVEGPANRLIANFKHHLEHHIIGLMSNALIHNVKMLKSITRCEPFIYGYVEDNMNPPKYEKSHFLSGPLRNGNKTRRPIGRKQRIMNQTKMSPVNYKNKP